MGAALGYAIAQSIPVTLAVFIALGLGMALPYVLLAWFPGWRRRLPKPGVWMERVKQFLAFPLYATVAWLAWVLGAQWTTMPCCACHCAGLRRVRRLGMRVFRTGGMKSWGVAAAASLIAMGVLVTPLVTGAVASVEARALRADIADDWRPFTPADLASLRADGRPVFVDFTAAWCVTCQVNSDWC